MSLHWEWAEFVALVFEPLDGEGEGVAEVPFGFEGVVEYDYGSVAGVAFDVFEYLFSVEAPGVVACDEVVHDDVVVALDESALSWGEESVGWAEEGGCEEGVGFGYVSEVSGV